MDLFLLKDTVADAEVAVNPDQIRYLRGGPEGRVTIVFDDEQTITVEGSLRDVVSHLKSGHRA